MESMTGYGESRFQLEGVNFHFRIRSLNSRYFECEYLLPPELRWMENNLDTILRGKFNRGKIQLFLEADRSLPHEVGLDRNSLNQYRQMFGEFYGKKNMNIPLDVLVHIPGIFDSKPVNWRSHWQRFEFYFFRALLRMERARQKEGKKIRGWMRSRLRIMQRYNQKISILHARMLPKRLRESRKKIREYYGGDGGDIRRLWPEIREEVVRTAVNDITEEIERLNFHLPEVLRIIDQDPQPGRKLEFYFQELLREVNTLSSKTYDSQINQIGIQMKLEIEKLREQTRNTA